MLCMYLVYGTSLSYLLTYLLTTASRWCSFHSTEQQMSSCLAFSVLMFIAATDEIKGNIVRLFVPTTD